MSNYWDKVLQRRLSRRRALAVSGGLAVGTALLAACGGGGEEEAGPKDTSGLVTTFEDSSKQAQRGGTFVINNLRDPLHLDGQAQGQIQLNVFNSLAYEGLVMNKMGFKEPTTWSEVEPNLAEDWELTPDKLTLTFNLRQGVKWHNKAPINGRAFDSSDILASWKRYETATTPNNKAANANSANPAAPIISVAAPDARTVVWKLKEPSSYLLQRFTTMITGELGSIYPKEAGAGFDPKVDQIGTGAFVLDKYQASLEIAYKRNPEYWNKNAGFFDAIRFPLLPDYAAGLAQFKAGSLSHFNVGAQDILTTKREVKAINLYVYTPAANNPTWTVRFGWNPIGGKKSPFLDIRLRQAISMSFDRDQYIDTFSNVAKFQAEGLPIQTYWFTSMGYVPDWMLDPRDKEFGDNGKFYQYNVAEAKKLVDAARSAYGGDFPEIPAGRVNVVFGPTYAQQVEVMDQWIREIGLKVKAVPLDYNLEYLKNYVTQQGKVEGYFHGSGAVTSPTPLDLFIWRFYSKSGGTSGALGFGGTDGSLGNQSGDPEVDKMIERAKAEFDVKKLRGTVHELQRYLAQKAYGVCQPGFADSLTMAWPAISNFMTYQGESRTVFPNAPFPSLHNTWYDASKPHKA